MNPKELLIDALPIIKQFSPTIAGAIGGPIGIALGYVIPVLSQIFGVHATDVKSLAGQIINDPNAADKLKLAEENHSDFIKGLLDNINDLSSAEITIKLNWDTTQ